MAKDKICTPFLALASPENKFTVSTIEDMQSRKYLKIGDVVELNGYYTAGDGAGHKRKIEATDDGSGVQLANGLWANIVHNGEVNVSWFGAKGDGVTNNTDIFVKISNYTNNTQGNITISFKTGIYICGKQWVRGGGNPQIPYYGFQKEFFSLNETTNNVIFKGNFSTIKIQEGLRYGAFSKTTGEPADTQDYQDLIGVGDFIYFLGRNIKIKDFNYDGSCDNVILGGKANGSIQVQGRFFRGSSCTGFVEVENINSKNACLDHLSFYMKTPPDKTTIDNIWSLKNCSLDLCGRNGISSGGTDMFTMENVTIRRSGQAQTANNPRYGIDFEPETSGVLKSGYMNNVVITESSACAIGSSYESVKNLTIDNSYFCQTNVAYIFYFKNPENINIRNCTIIGRLSNCTSLGKGSPFIIDSSIITNNISKYSRYGEVAENKDLIGDKYILEYVDCVKNSTIEMVGAIRTFYELQVLENCKLIFLGKELLTSYKPPVRIIGRLIIESEEEHENKLIQQITKHSLETSRCSCIVENGVKTEYGMMDNSFKFIDRNSQFKVTNRANGELEANTGDILIYNSPSSCKILFCTKGGSNSMGTQKTYIAVAGSNKITVSGGTPRFLTYDGSDIGLTDFAILDYDVSTKVALINKKSLVSGDFSFKVSPPSYKIFEASSALTLDTPYHTLKMQQEGVYDDFVAYMDEKTEYDRFQRELEQQRQLAFENRENQGQTYEEWLAEQPMLLPVTEEPRPSEALLKFKEKYLG